jgi:1,4-dihydroxy-2-naphthoyl-CoA hydrolase
MADAFRFPYTIGLHDTDAFGILYSANIIRICMTANEAMLKQIGFGLDVLFRMKVFGMPVVHTEADFIKPLTVGMDTEIVCRVEQFGTSSYRVGYVVKSLTGEDYARAATVQVCVDAKSRKTIDIPADFRAALERYA